MGRSIVQFKKKEFPYDGFYINPHADGVEYSYFKFNDEATRGVNETKSEIGDEYHIMLWWFNKIGLPVKDEVFEAVLVDPEEYVKNLNTSHNPFYGCIVRKTTASRVFVEEYMNRLEISFDKSLKLVDDMLKGVKS